MFVREEERIYEAREKGRLRGQNGPFRLIDVFAGAGGMTLGFSAAFSHSFEPVWANDFNVDCVGTYKENFGDHCVAGDIVDILNDPATKIPIADVVIGGPPCQGFSLLNKNRETDPRKQLWRQYFEVVERSLAQVLVMENVPQLLGSFEHGEIVGAAEKLITSHGRLGPSGRNLNLRLSVVKVGKWRFGGRDRPVIGD